MSLFGLKLSRVERHRSANVNKTKSVFPEETQIMEYGLALMFDLTEALNQAVKKDATPHLYVNRNLFARNRQLLLNGYICQLTSNYGTQFVVLRTVLENENLMRLFKLHPQYAYEWLSSEKQKRFPPEVQAKYGESSIHDRPFENWWVRKELFKEIGQESVAKHIKKIYGELCQYTHPNFRGWHELMGLRGEEEIIFSMPPFSVDNAFEIVGLTLYLMQLSFKTVVETFRDYISDWTVHTGEWQNAYSELIIRYAE